LIRSVERDFDGFLKFESLDFFETPSPNEIVGGKSGAKRSDIRRQKATTNLSPVVASAHKKVSPIVARNRRFLSLSQRNWISL
jgi:hypothetical protein